MDKYRINEREYICPLQLALNVMLGKWKGMPRDGLQNS
jgi:hypothetical protein